jgi:ABC-type nitrate/sulfonate/bicarbonate transport system substrate-binding protein
MRNRFVFLCGLLCAFSMTGRLCAQDKIRIAYVGPSLSNLPLLAARELGIFSRNKLDVEILLLTSQLSAVALGAGELEYVAGVGPGSVSGTLAGIPSRAVWVVSNRILHSVVAQPELKTLADLRGKKIGVTGLGGTTHTALTMAIEKFGGNPREYVVVSLGPQQYLRSMESRAVDAATIDPPLLFVVLKKGFSRVLDLGSVVEMPVGGLTTLIRIINSKPDQIVRVIKSLQEAKNVLLHSQERAIDFTIKVMKMDRETALQSYQLMTAAWAGTGVPTRASMDNIIRGIQSQGRFAEKKVAFEDVAEPRFALQVARELGAKTE